FVLCRTAGAMRAFRFRIPFKNPVRMKGQSYSHREGVLLERDGNWAEASPLPGFSTETIGDVIFALQEKLAPPPSLAFALSALDDAVAEPVQVPFNFLLLGNTASVIAAAKSCSSSGCRAAKLKVGQNSLEDDVALVHQVREILPAAIQLRLDANQAWGFEQALSFLDATKDVELEYIEEPLSEPRRLEELYDCTQVKYALDETLVQTGSLAAWPNAAALICKPTFLGGRKAVERLAQTGKPIVFSAAFESGVGVARVAQLAAEFSPEVPAGLDTLDWLGEDLLVSPPEKQNGLIAFPNPLAADESGLEIIEL
ncbi:MAG: o-succinylbenzoate synthase, partial [Planctomycetota bacterium]